MDLGTTKVSVEKSTDGVWVDIDEKTKLKIARFLNPKHRAYVNRAMDPYKRASRIGQLDDATTDKVEIEAIANCILIDWKGITENGEEVKYSVKKAIAYLSDPSLPHFISMVRELSNEMALFHEDTVQDASTNLKK